MPQFLVEMIDPSPGKNKTLARKLVTGELPKPGASFRLEGIGMIIAQEVEEASGSRKAIVTVHVVRKIADQAIMKHGWSALAMN